MVISNESCNEPLTLNQWSHRHTWQYIVESASNSQKQSFLLWRGSLSLFDFLLLTADCCTPALLLNSRGSSRTEVLGVIVSAIIEDWLALVCSLVRCSYWCVIVRPVLQRRERERQRELCFPDIVSAQCKHKTNFLKIQSKNCLGQQKRCLSQWEAGCLERVETAQL